MTVVRVIKLDQEGDKRGFSVSIDNLHNFLAAIEDIHIMTLKPDNIRGNHYHLKRREVMTVIYFDRWSFYWDSGPDSEINRQYFTGEGAVRMEIEPYSSHAISNDGSSDLFIIDFSDQKYTPENPDAHYRKVV